MSHELDRNAHTGRLASFSVRLTPWHREGFTLAEAPSLAEGLRLAGADYQVALAEVHATMPANAEVHPGALVDASPARAVVRLDRGTVLAVVGEDYRPLQNRDAFQILEPLLDAGVAQLETGGTLREGRDAWMMVRFNIADPVVQEAFAGEVIPFGLIANNHSGERRALLMETPVRVVCANTLGQATRGARVGHSVSVTHRGDARVKLVDAAQELFAQVVDRYRVIGAQYVALRARILSVEEFTRTVLDTLAPMPSKAEMDALTPAGRDRSLDRLNATRSTVSRLWTAGTGHTGNLSAWEAYNGAVEALDHDPETFRATGSRLQSLMTGRLGYLKSQVLTELVGICAK